MKTYDILNAGPKNRFMANKRIVSNSGNILQPQNLPQNHLLDLTLARDIVKSGDFELLDMIFGNVPNVLSELIRTVLVPRDGCRFIVADFSAIEARVVAWLANETWVLETFKLGGDIYCETASRMFHVPVEKHGINGHLRQKGKQCTLSCSYGGSIGALKSMGAIEAGMNEDELEPLVTAWRTANPHIVKLWHEVGGAAMRAVKEKTMIPLGRLCFFYESGILFIRLPSGRRLSYIKPRIGTNRFGSDSVTYMGIGASKKWERLETFGGKLVENCVAEDTMVITNRGLVAIQNIKNDDLIWDGIEFVSHDGVIAKGIRPVIQIGNLLLTADHRILTRKGWISCGKSDGLEWAEVPLPYRLETGRKQQFRETAVAVPMRVRKFDRSRGVGLKEKEISDKIVRMYAKQIDFKGKDTTRNESSSGIRSLALNETTMRRYKSSLISQLWRTWHQGLQTVAAQFREFLGGYGFYIQNRNGLGQDRQQQRILARELSLDFKKNKQSKSSDKSLRGQSLRINNCGGTIRKMRNRCYNSIVSNRTQLSDRIVVYDSGISQPVYDIINCGIRHRFAVWDNGKCRIVSNCTQAIARDLLAEAMLRVTAAGYDIVFHVHDEIIAEMPDSKGSVEEMCALMSVNPDWADGLPLNADGYECEYYRKD